MAFYWDLNETIGLLGRGRIQDDYVAQLSHASFLADDVLDPTMTTGPSPSLPRGGRWGLRRHCLFTKREAACWRSVAATSKPGRRRGSTKFSTVASRSVTLRR